MTDDSEIELNFTTYSLSPTINIKFLLSPNERHEHGNSPSRGYGSNKPSVAAILVILMIK